MATAVVASIPTALLLVARPALRRRRRHRRRGEGLTCDHSGLEPSRRFPTPPWSRAGASSTCARSRSPSRGPGSTSRRSIGLHTCRRRDPPGLPRQRHAPGLPAPTPSATATRSPAQWRACPTASGVVRPRTAVSSALSSTAPRTLRLRGPGLGLRLTEAAGELTPFTGAYLFRDPVDGAAVFTSYETGRRYRVTVLAGALESTGARGARPGRAARSSSATPSGAWEADDRRDDERRAAPDQRAPSTTSSRAGEATFADFVDDARAVAQPTRRPAATARRVRAVVGDRRPGGHARARARC